jgi:hypothetical protein
LFHEENYTLKKENAMTALHGSDILLDKGKLTVKARQAKLMAEQKARHGAKRTVSTR